MIPQLEIIYITFFISGGGFNNAKDHKEYDKACERTNHLKSIEEDLDRQLEYAQRNLHYIMQDPTNQSYAYVTRDDLLQIFGDDSVFTIPNYDEEVEIHRSDVCKTYISFFVYIFPTYN